MLNERELMVKDRYETEGWKVLRGGAPDFMMLKVVDGKIEEMMGVEVKSPRADLTYEQLVYKKIFELAGIEYKVEVEE